MDNKGRIMANILIKQIYLYDNKKKEKYKILDSNNNVVRLYIYKERKKILIIAIISKTVYLYDNKKEGRKRSVAEKGRVKR